MQHIAPQCTHRCSKCFCTVNLLLFFRWNIQPENCWLIFISKCRATSVWACFQSNLKVHLLETKLDLVKILFSKKEQDKFRCLADDLWKTHILFFMRHYNECVISLHMIFFTFLDRLYVRASSPKVTSPLIQTQGKEGNLSLRRRKRSKETKREGWGGD